MKKAVGIIPARWASTRFPGKPLYPIAGKPLLRHVWERSLRAKSLDTVIIATDDTRIAEAAFDWGAEVALTSPYHRSGTDRVAEVARKLKETAFVLNIQGDEPLVEPRLLDRLVDKLRRDPTVQIVTAAHPFKNLKDMSSPHQVKVIVGANGIAVDFTRKVSRNGELQLAEMSVNGGRLLRQGYGGQGGHRRSVKLRVLRHQGIYGFRRAAILKFVGLKQTPREKAESLEQLRALENGVSVHVLVTKHGWPGVDTPVDAKALEQKLARAKRRTAH